jgi:hypothetical protein
LTCSVSIILRTSVFVIKSGKKKGHSAFRSGLGGSPERLQPLFQDRGGFESNGAACLDIDCGTGLRISTFAGFA